MKPVEIDEKVRSHEFEALKSHYFNAAYMGPLPKRAQIGIEKALARSADPSFLDYGWVGFTDLIRAKLAELLRVSPDQISLNSSTSEVISTVAFGMGLGTGDRIALLDGEYPSGVLPWLVVARRTGAEVDFVRPELAADPVALVRGLSSRTKAFGVSHVSFQTGTLVDLIGLGRALKERGIFFVVDVTQSLGGMPISPEALCLIDVMACSTYKWMLGPYGQAFGYWAEGAIRRVNPIQAGWLGMPQAPYDLTKYTVETKPGARKFDRGQAPNILGLHGLEGSLELLLELGLEPIYRYNQTLVERFRAEIPDRDYEVLTRGAGSNIVCLRARTGDSKSLQKRLREAGIDVSVREGNVRLSFHLFNTMREVQVLLSALAKT